MRYPALRSGNARSRGCWLCWRCLKVIVTTAGRRVDEQYVYCWIGSRSEISLALFCGIRVLRIDDFNVTPVFASSSNALLRRSRIRRKVVIASVRDGKANGSCFCVSGVCSFVTAATAEVSTTSTVMAATKVQIFHWWCLPKLFATHRSYRQ